MLKINKVLFAVLLISFVSFAQTKWTFDKTHTQVKFSVTHLVITEVEGFFGSYDGNVEAVDENFENAKISFTIDVASINTDNEKRDNHLRSEDFFAAEKYPKITFTSKSLKKIDGKKYKMTGDLTMRGVTKEVELDVKYNGVVNDPWGNTKAGFKITGELDRFDYGLKWNALLETGGAVVSKEVSLTINVELTKA